MKRLPVLFFLLIFCTGAAIAQVKWIQVDNRLVSRTSKPTDPVHYLVFSTDEPALKQLLQTASRTSRQIVTLPLADGSMMEFQVWPSTLLPGKLAAKYPELRAYNAVAVDNRNITAKLDETSFGFHAMICNGRDVSFVDPVEQSPGLYVAHFKRDETRPSGSKMNCGVTRKGNISEATRKIEDQAAARTSNGYTLRTYRLALSCDNYYARAATGLASPTIAQTLSKMITTMNRVNGVYERELSITMNFVENEDTLIWTSPLGGVNGTDPYDSLGYDTVAESCIVLNQQVCDARIHDTGYDIGHVFTTGAGGLSGVGVTCQSSYKAYSVTGQPDPVGDGFDIDYVSHEMGHEYGADHPFNDDSAGTGSCNTNTIWTPTAYEPGSGSTIMAYAGICAPEDLQPHSDAYFNSVSLLEIQSYINSYGGTCAVKTPTNNKLVDLPPFSASYSIPYLTPFELTAPAAADSVNDTSVTYCWEQWNLGDFGSTLINTHVYGPIFRSYYPTTSLTRIFPKNEMVLAGVLSNAGIENNQGEKAPDAARYLTFHLTVRDIYDGNGCFLVPDDTVHLDVINTGSGFVVTSQADSSLMYFGNSTQQITWNVVGTNAAPINAQKVDIYLSADGGNTWNYSLGTFPNTGSALVTLPNPDTNITAARIKVKGTGNVFFNVNKNNFTVLYDNGKNNNISLLPNPAHSYVLISSGDKGIMQTEIVDVVGQLVWKGTIDGELKIPVTAWARGMYVMRCIDASGHRTVKKFVVQ